MILELKRVKRFLLASLLVSVPLVWAEPLSVLQESVTRPGFKPVISVQRTPVKKFRKEIFISGTASWYSQSDPGINRHTANGEVFDDSELTCAAWNFPFGTHLEVQNIRNGKSV